MSERSGERRRRAERNLQRITQTHKVKFRWSSLTFNLNPQKSCDFEYLSFSLCVWLPVSLLHLLFWSGRISEGRVIDREWRQSKARNLKCCRLHYIRFVRLWERKWLQNKKTKLQIILALRSVRRLVGWTTVVWHTSTHVSTWVDLWKNCSFTHPVPYPLSNPVVWR